MAETDQGVHQGQLPRVIQFQAGNPPAIGQNGGLRQLAQLPAVDEGF